MDITMCLLKGRHALPVDCNAVYSVFKDGVVHPSVITDVDTLENIAFNGIYSECQRHGATHHVTDEDGEWIEINKGEVHITLYVTGLSVALIAALNVCRNEDIKVTLMHYDSVTGNYYPQEVR